jgi:glycosyltransferase involved in cell wall biosynthesis
MKVGIYQEHSGGFGGSEYVAAVMAQTLRNCHEVEIVHHRHDLSVERLASFFNIDLNGVKTRYIPHPQSRALDIEKRPYRCNSVWREWNASASRGYDLFIANVHGIPPFCHARHGVLHVLFPMFNRNSSWQWRNESNHGISRLRAQVRRWMYERGWRQRMASYSKHYAISRYSAEWTERYWGVHVTVLYPPVEIGEAPSQKDNSIISLGRFTRVKRQVELLKAFIEDIRPYAPKWDLVFVGGASAVAEDSEYLLELQRLARGLPVRFVVNASREEVLSELSRAKVLWHGMGLGANAAENPERVEHFGIAPVEAMAVGCVPVVLRSGGTSETVVDDVSGYTCDSIGDMAKRIIGLIQDDEVWTRLSTGAKRRAPEFAVDQFQKRFAAEMASLLASK